MNKTSLNEIIGLIKGLKLAFRRRDSRGRQAVYSDELIISIAIYQRMYSIKQTNSTLDLLKEQGYNVPATSTFSERKKQLLTQIILACKALIDLGKRILEHDKTKLHIDSNRLKHGKQETHSS